MKIGKIISVEDIPNSEKLVKLQVDFGDEKKQCVAGIRKHYSEKDLLDKKFVFVMNLERRKMMGIESECMILASEDTNGKIILLQPSADVGVGSKIR